MVLIESMACGTPVLAMSRGSVPEVLRQGISGLVGNSIDELVALAPQIGHLDRRACRAEAERRFSARVMADSYEQIYHRAIAERQSEELARALGAGVQRVPTSVRGI
jgi:glycosyltransferase involved in cell wall biosynthesis